MRDAVVITEPGPFGIAAPRIEYVNPAFTHLTGFTPSEVVGKSLGLLNGRGLDSAGMEKFRAATMDGQSKRIEVSHFGKDQKLFRVEMDFTPIRGERTGIDRWLFIQRDVSQRKELEDRLCLERQRLTVALLAGQMGVYEWDLLANHLWWSHEIYLVFGVNPETFMPTQESFNDLVHPEDRQALWQKAETSISQHRVFVHEFRILRPDGQLRWIRNCAQAEYDSQGGAVRQVGVAIDITERKQLEAELEAALAQLKGHTANLEKTVAMRTATLQEAVHDLEHFSYTLTHDMRAPLRAMQGFAAIAQDESAGRLTPTALKSLKKISEGALRMDALICDALQYTKVALGDFPIETVDPEPLLRVILQSYPNLLKYRTNIHIVQPLPPVLANPAGLNQCFSNLLNNAVKFVAPGVKPHVRIWAEVLPALESVSPPEHTPSTLSSQSSTLLPCVRFWFEDNGIGIAPEHQSRVFDMFQRLSKDYEGTGVGLAVVRKAASRMGGRVGVESEPGKGSRFWLELKKA